MKIKIKSYLHRFQDPTDVQPLWMLYPWKNETADCIFIREETITVEVPDGDMLRERLAVIDDVISKTRAEAEIAIQKLFDKRGKLLALTNEGGSA